MKNIPLPVAVAVVVVAVLIAFVIIRRATTPTAPQYTGPPRSAFDSYRSSGQPGR
jgi:hypothetical protein